MNMHKLIMEQIIRNWWITTMSKVLQEPVEPHPTMLIPTCLSLVREKHLQMWTQHLTSRTCSTSVLWIPVNAISCRVKTTIFQIRSQIILIIIMMIHQRHKILTAKMIFIIHNLDMMSKIFTTHAPQIAWYTNTKLRLTGIQLLIRCTFKVNPRVKPTIAEWEKRKINCNLKTPCNKLQVDFI